MGTELPLKQRPCSNAFPELLKNLDLVAAGLRAALSMSGEPRGAGWRGRLLFHISCLSAPVAKQHRWFYSWQPSVTKLSYWGACPLSACPRRQFSVCSLFSVVVFAILQPCILFRSWWGLWWGTSWWKGNFTAQTRSQKNTHFSTLGSTLSYYCSSSRGLTL